MHPNDFLDLGGADTIERYLQLVLEKRVEEGMHTSWMFRGQRELRWSPVPKIDRPEFQAYRTGQGWVRKEHEDRLLTDFITGARAHVRIEPKDLWEWLAVAQHHGLATRLLDWTANPLAALYFAVEETHATGDSTVWCYLHRGDSWLSHRLSDPFVMDHVIEFRPPHVTPRITVQRGVFHRAP